MELICATYRLIWYSCNLCCMWSPTLNRRSELQHFERGNATEIHNRVMFDFYLGIPQMRFPRDIVL